MWNDRPHELLQKYEVSLKSFRIFNCTGKHLIPHCEGGSSKETNIVAACWYCNSKCHQRKIVKGVDEYKSFVGRRLRHAKWNSGIISEKHYELTQNLW